jgi:hypothetical protein
MPRQRPHTAAYTKRHAVVPTHSHTYNRDFARRTLRMLKGEYTTRGTHHAG